jgi:geranylgeranylglycerol-phosphate geranylgeranyltransferase
MGNILSFTKAYIKSMRLYYSFVTGIAGWIGVAYYQFIANSYEKIGTSNIEATIETPTALSKQIVILIFLFLAWGVNQIINDYLGLKEDKINAPQRPMVSGTLNITWALSLSGFLMAVMLFVTWFYLEPVAIIPLVIGALLNVVYEYAKGHGILGNIVFGLMISSCSLFGFFASGPLEVYFTQSRYVVLFLIILINGLMTFYTYFKDYEGDKLAHKNTLVVKYGINTSRIIALCASFLPVLSFLLIYYVFHLLEIHLNNIFIYLGMIYTFLQVWTGWLYFKYPVGEKTYYSLSANFRALTCGQATLIALFNPELAMILFILSYIFVGFLFDLHTNSKA